LFGGIFGGGGGRGGRNRGPAVEKGRDLKVSVSITLEDAYRGKETEIALTRLESCETCHGSGAKPGTKPKTCPQCKGSGAVRYQQGFFSFNSVCDICQGSGSVVESPCSTCSGRGRVNQRKHVKVRIPAGVDNETLVRVSQEGEVGPNNGPRGDLFIQIKVKPHEIFERHDDDLVCNFPISISQATLGDEIDVPTMDEPDRITIPAGTQPHTTFKIAGKGMPRPNDQRRKGDLYIRVMVQIPTTITDRERELYRELAEINKESINEKKGFFSRVKEEIKEVFGE
jgi:molecular chaperone DnaJ